jgi:hypothetical protein
VEEKPLSILLLILALVFSSCGGDTSVVSKRLIGKWRAEDIIVTRDGKPLLGGTPIISTVMIEFFEDGTYLVIDQKGKLRGKYTIVGSNKIKFERVEADIPKVVLGSSYTNDFNLLADKLTLTFDDDDGHTKWEFIYLRAE